MSNLVANGVAPCVVFSLADRAGSPVLASVVVVVGGIVLALGETGLAAGRWSLSLGLAPEDRRGQKEDGGTTSIGVA